MDKLTLHEGLIALNMSQGELYVRYLALGGQSTAIEVAGFVRGEPWPSSYEHDLIAQALNERSLEDGGDHPVGYLRYPR